MRAGVRARRAGHGAGRPSPDSAHPPARAHRALTSGRCSSRTCVNMITHTVARPGLGCRLWQRGRPRSASMTSSFRVEHDSMGEVKVPAEALWGAHTQRAVQNFPVSGLTMPRAFIGALGLVKQAAARVNRDLKLLEPKVAQAVEEAAAEVAAGVHDEQFPIDVFQTGSGTSSNMNANEVIAA